MNEKDYQFLQKTLKGFEEKKIVFYITGSQGVAPAEMIVTFGVEVQCIEDIRTMFYSFIDENAMEYIDDYLDDCDGDVDDALGEVLCDSGEFWIGTPSEYCQILLEDL